MERIEVYDMARAIALYLVLVSVGRVDRVCFASLPTLVGDVFSVGEGCDIRVNQ